MAAKGDATGMESAIEETSAYSIPQPMSLQTRVPSAAKWLGALGAIPFVFLAVTGHFLWACVLRAGCLRCRGPLLPGRYSLGTGDRGLRTQSERRGKLPPPCLQRDSLPRRLGCAPCSTAFRATASGRCIRLVACVRFASEPKSSGPGLVSKAAPAAHLGRRRLAHVCGAWVIACR